MSRTTRVALVPALTILIIGLVAAAGLAITGSGDPKHATALSRFRMWGGVALILASFTFIFSVPASLVLRRLLAAASSNAYRGIVGWAVATAVIAMAFAVYLAYMIKPPTFGAIVALNILAFAGLLFGYVASIRLGSGT